MHLRFSLDHLQASPQNRALYITQVISGKLNLFQKELTSEEVIHINPHLMVNESYIFYSYA